MAPRWTVDESAGVDERDVLEHPPRRDDAGRDRREARHGFHALGDAKQAEDVHTTRWAARQRGGDRGWAGRSAPRTVLTDGQLLSSPPRLEGLTPRQSVLARDEGRTVSAVVD